MADAKKKSKKLMWIVVLGMVAALSLVACAGIGVTLYLILGPQRFSFGADSQTALKNQIRDVFEENKAGGNTKAKEMLKLPESWFVKTFGDAKGKEMYGKYSAKAGEIERRFLNDLAAVKQQGFANIEVEEYSEKFILLFFRRTLDAMSPKPTLHQVFVPDPAAKEEGTVFGPFVFNDGSFRYFSGEVVWNP